ncbi:UDP-glucose dehydrogenase family protein [Ilumatobacter sp.]|uniref:UDP-glucose dehydrogenase family protein n=1 Tax=Ilumatobacter sp. TaxID=1967498 RepID=UPI003AF5F799
MSTNTSPQRIAVIGTGYVGLTTGASLAHFGFDVACCDIDERKVSMLQQGIIPIVEDGLSEMVADGQASGRLTFHLGSIESVSSADVVFLCVPTPQDDDGSADLTYVKLAATEIGPHLRPGAVVVNKSTVPVGSFHLVGEALARADVDVVSNPEFLREGSAVHDCLHPDRVVIGAENPDAAAKVAALYESLDTQIILTDPASAETIKYAANGFLAMKISFINSVAAMCEQVGADVAAVVAGIGSDGRIGPQFLNPGPGWGGSCFPKDSRALVSIARERGYDFSLMRGVIDINEQQYERMVSKITRSTGRFAHDRLDGVIVAALGLTFKAGTDDLRESPSVRILRDLERRGATIQAYDPTTVGDLDEIQRARLSGFDVRSSVLDAVSGADVVAVLTEWPEFSEIDLPKMVEVMRGNNVVDCRNLLEPTVVKAAGLTYDGVGRS